MSHYRVVRGRGTITIVCVPLDAPEGPSKMVYGSPLPCQICGRDSWTQTSRQTTRGEHPTCTGWCDELTLEAYRRVTFEIAKSLGACIIGGPADVRPH